MPKSRSRRAPRKSKRRASRKSRRVFGGSNRNTGDSYAKSILEGASKAGIDKDDYRFLVGRAHEATQYAGDFEATLKEYIREYKKERGIRINNDE